MSKLKEMFEDGWYKVLESHLQSQAFREIGFRLKEMSKNKVEITPRFEDTFRAFKECSWENLHTVLIGQDPYPGVIDRQKRIYVADGLAFSSRYSEKIPKSLAHIYTAVDQDIYNGESLDITDTFDLVKWANQGILLLNAALSFPVGQKSGAHVNLWQPFISYVLKTINGRKDSIAFGLFGSYAKAYKPFLNNDTFGVYTCEHPAAADYRMSTWKHEGIFKAIDGFQKSMNNINIKW